MKRSSVCVFAPATVANVGSAFDVLGFAVDQPGDEVTASFSRTPGVTISSIEGDGGKLPYDPEKNTAAVAAREALKRLGRLDAAISLDIRKKMPLGSGLGSSAASAAAGALAINVLLEGTLSKAELVQCAMAGERVACGTAHADNVAPAIYGGFVLIRSYEPLDLIKLPTPPDLQCVLAHPRIEVLTEDARKILKKQVPLKKAVKQCAQVAGLIAGIFSANYGLIGRSVEDEVIEPERSSLIPGYYKVKNAALEAGAFGCGISGSGPSLFAFVTSFSQSQAVGDAMRASFKEEGIETDIFSSPINDTGAFVVD